MNKFLEVKFTLPKTMYGVKKVFNPKSLPATKGDIETMLTQIQELQHLLIEMKFKNKFGLK